MAIPGALRALIIGGSGFIGSHVLRQLSGAGHTVAVFHRIRNELGYSEGVAIEKALELTVAWVRAHPPLEVDARRLDYAAEDAALREFGR